MKRFISLAFCCCFFSSGWADEFKLEFSKDIIDAAGTQQDGIETHTSTKAVKPSNPILVSATPQGKSEPEASALDASQKKQVSPPEPIYSKQPAHSSRKDDSRPADDNFAPLRVSPDKVFGGVGLPEQFWQANKTVQNQQNLDIFDQLRDEFELMVGDDIYTRMVWSYDSVKEMDNWLSATFSQLTMIDGGSIFVGLNDQIIANFTAPEQIGMPGRNAKSLEDSHADALKTPEYAARYGVNQALVSANFESQSKFFVVLKYLTLINLLYLILTIVALVYMVKFFRFLIKQR
jgi:hypothetical protein